MAEVAMVGAGAASSAAGSALGNAANGSGGGSTPYSSATGQIQPMTPAFITTMNNMLQNSMNNAIQYSTGYTNQATQQQTNSLGAATSALNTGLTNANQAATTNATSGFNQAQALQAPYASAGYGALDAYQDSLGLSRAQMGSQALSGMLNTASQAQPLLQQIQNLGQAQTLGTGLTDPTLQQYEQQVTPQQIQQYLSQNITSSNQGGHTTYSYGGVGNNTPGIVDTRIGQAGGAGYLTNELSNNSTVAQDIAAQLAQTPYNQALQQYQTQYGQQQATQTQQQQLFNQLQNLGYSPQLMSQAQGYNQGLFTKGNQ